MRPVPAACCGLLIATLGAMAQTSARPDATSHIGKAVRLMEQRQFDQAAVELEAALAADPNNDQVRIQYATCLFAEERNEEARRQFEIERRRFGDAPGLSYYLGRLDLRANDYASAIQRLAPLESNPAFLKAPLYLGLAYMGAGQPARALECLAVAAKRNPRDPEVHYRLARAYSMANRDDEANREYKLYRETTENQRLAEIGGSDCADALRIRPIAQARVICQPLADPDDSHRLILLGQLYCDHRAFADAVEPLRRATELDPESFDAWQYLGLSLFRLERYAEALPPLRKAASLNPQYFSSLVLLASALHAVGDDAAALPILERAHSLNPDDAQVTSAIERLRANRKSRK